jgi:hypothetical protein
MKRQLFKKQRARIAPGGGGLKHRWTIDDDCNNVSSHGVAASGNCQTISAAKLITFVDEQPTRTVYWGCVPVDPYSRGGGLRAIGVLFKLELAPDGYMFVTKGT